MTRTKVFRLVSYTSLGALQQMMEFNTAYLLECGFLQSFCKKSRKVLMGFNSSR